MSTTYKACSPR